MLGSFDTAFDSLSQLQTDGDGDASGGPMANGIQLADIERLDVTRQVQPGSQEALTATKN